LRRNLVVFAMVTTLVVAASLACGLPLSLSPSPPQPPLVEPTSTAAPPPLAPPPPEAANALEAQVVAVYEQSAPAVVNITSRSVAYDFFMRPVPQEGTGSGFLYDATGHIVTNYHVVENAESVSVAFPEGEVYEAEVVGVDPSTDLAVLYVAARELPAPIAVSDSDRLRVGQFVVAIGNPFGQEGTLTVGVISALGRIIESPDGRFIGEAIQTDAAINPGNSGGPMLDLLGQVIGVNSQIVSPVQGSSGVGFAVSSNTVRRVVPELIANGRYPHPWMGVALAPFEVEGAALLREAGMDIPADAGLLVTEVVPGSPAEAAGIRSGDRLVRIGQVNVPVGGDVILAIDGVATVSYRDLNVYLDSETRVGDTVQVTLIRNGQQIDVPLTLAERPEQA
jgi:S1-C subfamily serine protease